MGSPLTGWGDNIAINTSLTGRLRNTSLPKSHALLPLFEAVVNAIQAIDEAHDGMGAATVQIEILRAEQPPLPGADHELGTPALAPIVGFEVRDNGEGFHDPNFDSFQTLDSEYKSARGGRGVGRLLWLKAFERVEVTSRFKDPAGSTKCRSFTFTARNGVAGELVKDASDDAHTGAIVRLISFRDMYRRSAPKTTASIAKSILEHCLWYFVRPGGAPQIDVIDNLERVDLGSIFQGYMVNSSRTDHFSVKGQPFELVNLNLRNTVKVSPQLNWCAAARVVIDENLSGKIPGLYGRLKDPDGEFVYACFLTSRYLDEHVRSERTGFDIPEQADGTLDEDEPSMSDIRAAAFEQIQAHLRVSLEEVRRAGRARVERFVDNKAPRYRPVLRHIADEKLTLDPEISDRDLELQLHTQLADLERELLAEGQAVLDVEVPQDGDYDARLQEYLTKVKDVNKSDLAAYVSRRRVVLDLLQRAIQADGDGRYAREDAIHNLIMPMRTTSDEVPPDASNLWIIDERLAFHNFLASDKPLSSMPIIDSSSTKEPDLLSLRLTDLPVLVSEGWDLPLATVTVVEIKRPMRNDIGEGEGRDPIWQAQKYLERVRQGKVRTASGRPIPASEHVPGFIYVIADLTPTMRERCKYASLRPTQDGLGYFGYNENFKAYIEVVSFDHLVNSAKQRNRAFFDQLGLPAH